MIRVVESASNELRLAEARAFIRSELGKGDLLLVAASRGAADDLARSIAIEAGATLGLHRFSLTQLAARLAAPILAVDRRSPATHLGSEAVAARAAFESVRNDALTYFGPVAATPGFPRALARTLQELRLAHVSSADLAGLPLGGADLSLLLDQFEREGGRLHPHPTLNQQGIAELAAQPALGLQPTTRSSRRALHATARKEFRRLRKCPRSPGCPPTSR